MKTSLSISINSLSRDYLIIKVFHVNLDQIIIKITINYDNHNYNGHNLFVYELIDKTSQIIDYLLRKSFFF